MMKCYLTTKLLIVILIYRCNAENYVLVSRYKEASQSSTHGSGAVSSYGVDGRSNGNFPQKTCTHTAPGDNDPWWYVDLGATIAVYKIVIYNRVDCCADRLRGAIIRVGGNNVSPFTGNAQCGTALTSLMVGLNPIEIICSKPLAGQYVSIFLPGTKPLTLCEVEVYTVLVSRYKETSQSSTYSSGAISSYAVDGLTNGIFKEKTCTHTAGGENDPWWYVDLGLSVGVSKIVIYNRVDCCGDRLTGAIIRVGENNLSPFTGNEQCATTLTSSMVGSNPIEIICNNPIAGQYVSVYLPGTNSLTLCEVEVYTDGTTVEKPTSLSVEVTGTRVEKQTTPPPPVDINECFSQPCLNGATCNDHINLYTCDCSPEWSGDNCEIENTGKDVTGYLLTILLLVGILLMAVVFIIFYKLCHLKNTPKDHNTRRPMVHAEKNEMVGMSTALNDNQEQGYISILPWAKESVYEVPHSTPPPCSNTKF